MLIFDKQRESYQIVGYKQFDSLEPLRATFLNNGQPISLIDYYVRFECKKPDGNIVIDDENINIRNVCEIEMLLNEQVAVVNGNVKCQFVLVRKNDERQTSTFDFEMNIQQSVIAINGYSHSTITIAERLNKDIPIAKKLHEDLTKDIEDGNKTKQELIEKTTIAKTTINTLVEKTAEGNNTIDGLVEKDAIAKATDSKLNKTIDNANETNRILNESNSEADTTNARLQMTIDSGKDSIDKINATGNKSLIIGASQFINNEYTWKHDMNSEDLHVTFEDLATKLPLLPDYQRIDKNNILIRNSAESPNIKVVLSASYYQGNALFGTNVEEFASDSIGVNTKKVRLKDGNGIVENPVTDSDAVFMPDGTTKLTKKIDDISASLEQNKQEIGNIKTEYAKNIDVNNLSINKADKIYVDTKVAGISSGTPLFAPNLASMSDITKNYVNLSDGYIYTYSGTAFVKSTLQYQASGIADNSITSQKRTILGSNANLTYSPTTKTPNIDITNKTLTLYHPFFIQYNKFRFSSSADVVVSFESAALIQYLVFNVVTSTFRFVKTSLEALIDENEVVIDVLQLTRNDTVFDVSKAFGNFKYTINGSKVRNKTDDIEDNSITSQKRTVLGTNAKLYIHPNMKSPNIDTINKTLTFYSNYWVLVNKTRYALTGDLTIQFANTSIIHYLLFNTTNSTFRLLASSNESQILENEVILAIITLAKNDTTFEIKNIYSDCEFTIDNKSYSVFTLSKYIKSLEDKLNISKRFWGVEELVGEYIPSSSIPACDGTDTNGFNHNSTKSADIYVKYDELVAKYPNYISKTLLGNDASNTLPIYKYEFKPEQPVNRTEYDEAPKIILISGVHGSGTNPSGDNPTAVYSLYFILKDICDNWSTQNVLEYLRFNIHFIIIPVANPWGFDNRSRLNSNSVDINRNFGYKWISGDTHGASVFSEKESQYIKTVIDNNTDAIYVGDLHIQGGGSDPNLDNRLVWNVLNENCNTKLYYPARYLLSKLSRKWKGKYGLSDIPYYGHLDETNSDCTLRAYAEKDKGIPSSTFENSSATMTQTRNNKVIMQLVSDAIGNWIISVLKYFKNN